MDAVTRTLGFTNEKFNRIIDGDICCVCGNVKQELSVKAYGYVCPECEEVLQEGCLSTQEAGFE